MSTTDTNYTTLLQEIQNSTSPTFVNFGLDKPRFIINTNTRQIEIPTEFSFLSVRYNHNAETIYFEIDRYFEGEDLSNHTCIVQFANKDSSKKQEGIYVVKEMDMDSYEDKIVFKWEVENDATQIVGDITFSIRFYTVDSEGHFTYSFNTLPATSNILDTLNTTSEYDKTNPSALEFCVSKITSLANSVLFTQQELTEEQKKQARLNIGVVLEEDDENSSTTDINYTYDGDNESDTHTWITNAGGGKVFVKVSDIPNEGIDLIGATVSVFVPEYSHLNYTFIITDDMYDEVSGLTQILHQNAAVNDYTPLATVVICTMAGTYDIALNGWTENIRFSEPGIYFMDSRSYGGGKYVESLFRSGTGDSEEAEEIPIEYDGHEIQVFNRGICIGDSITHGTVDHSEGQINVKQYSYPTILSKMTGIDIVNTGVPGFTSKTWYDASVDGDSQGGRWVNSEWVWSLTPSVGDGDIVSESLDYSGFDFAVIHLGINDVLSISESITLETALATFETNINSIITKLKDSNTGIKIFLATIIPCYAYDGSVEYATFNEKIREITNSTDNVYLIDLNEYSALVHGSPYVNKHLTAIGYHKMASEISAYISYIISQNLTDFKWVQFIGTEFKY